VSVLVFDAVGGNLVAVAGLMKWSKSVLVFWVGNNFGSRFGNSGML